MIAIELPYEEIIDGVRSQLRAGAIIDDSISCTDHDIIRSVHEVSPCLFPNKPNAYRVTSLRHVVRNVIDGMLSDIEESSEVTRHSMSALEPLWYTKIVYNFT